MLRWEVKNFVTFLEDLVGELVVLGLLCHVGPRYPKQRQPLANAILVHVCKDLPRCTREISLRGTETM
jgi:hypothetical protein